MAVVVVSAVAVAAASAVAVVVVSAVAVVAASAVVVVVFAVSISAVSWGKAIYTFHSYSLLLLFLFPPVNDCIFSFPFFCLSSRSYSPPPRSRKRLIGVILFVAS